MDTRLTLPQAADLLCINPRLLRAWVDAGVGPSPQQREYAEGSLAFVVSEVLRWNSKNDLDQAAERYRQKRLLVK